MKTEPSEAELVFPGRYSCTMTMFSACFDRALQQLHMTEGHGLLGNRSCGIRLWCRTGEIWKAEGHRQTGGGLILRLTRLPPLNRRVQQCVDSSTRRGPHGKRSCRDCAAGACHRDTLPWSARESLYARYSPASGCVPRSRIWWGLPQRLAGQVRRLRPAPPR